MWIMNDQYLRFFCSYIHLNPVMAGLVSNPVEWAYSGCKLWLVKTNQPEELRTFIDSHFSSATAYEEALNMMTAKNYSFPKIACQYTLE